MALSLSACGESSQLYPASKEDGVLNVDWLPLDPPHDAAEHMRRVTLDSVMLEREPSRMDDYISFTYLDMLPECKGIINEKLIATGPSHLFFTNTTQPATAFLTDKRLVHLGQHQGLNMAVGSFHEKLAGFRPESTFDITVNWHDPRCPVLGFGPRFSKNGKENRYAMEWWYSFAQIAKNHFA
jgi:hypothetical protein